MDKGKRTIEITPQWAATIVVGAILTGLVTGAFAVGSSINSDHFAVAAIKENYVKKSDMQIVIYGINQLLVAHSLPELPKE